MAIDTNGGGYSAAAREAESTTDELAHWIQIVRGEYLEIPGLHLTGSQVQRLWGLDAVLCDRILEALVSVRFLQRTQGGAFVQLDDGSR